MTHVIATAQETGLRPNKDVANAHETGLHSREAGANHHEETGLDDHTEAFTRFLTHKGILFQEGREESDKLLEDRLLDKTWIQAKLEFKLLEARLMDKTWIQAKLVLEQKIQNSQGDFILVVLTLTPVHYGHNLRRNNTDTSAQWANRWSDPTILDSMTIPDQGSNKTASMRIPGTGPGWRITPPPTDRTWWSSGWTGGS